MFQSRCKRDTCKYFHPPPHLKQQVEINGRNNLTFPKNNQQRGGGPNQMFNGQNAMFHPNSMLPKNKSISSEYQANQQVYPPITPKWAQNNNNNNSQNNNNNNQPPGFNNNKHQSIGLLQDPSNSAQIQLDSLSQNFKGMNLNNNQRTNNSNRNSDIRSSFDSHSTQKNNFHNNNFNNFNQNSSYNQNNGPRAHIHISKRPDRLEVCRDALRKNCHRGENDCKYAHPRDNSQIDPTDNTVIVCMDSIKKRCNREHCKYYHPPPHLQQRVKLMQQQQQQQNGGMTGQITNFNPTAFINAVQNNVNQGMIVSINHKCL